MNSTVSNKLSLSGIYVAEAALIIYVIAVTAFPSGSVPVQVARILLIAGAATEITRKKFKVNKFVIWQVVFVLYAACSITWSYNPLYAINSAQTLLINALCVVSIMFIVIGDKRRIRTLLICMMVAPILLMLNVALTDGLLAFAHSRATESASANTLGMAAAYGACLSAWGFTSKAFSNRGLFAVLCLFNLGVVVLSASRKAIIIIIIALLLYSIVSNIVSRKKSLLRLTILSVLALVAVLAVMNVPFLYDMVGYRIEGMMNGLFGAGEADSSTTTRMRLIDRGIEFFVLQPVLGYGGGNFSALNFAAYGSMLYAHNNYIELLVNYGLLGCLAYYWMYLNLIASSIKNRSSLDALQQVVLVLLITLLIVEYGFVSYYDRYFQIFLSLAFVVLSQKNLVELTDRAKPNV